MKKLVREILFLRQGERRALFFASFLLLASLVFRVVVVHLQHEEKEGDPEFIEQLAALRMKLDSLEADRSEQQKRDVHRELNIIAHDFDPNTVEGAELLAMNLPEGLVKTMIRYREAGAVFYKAEDLKRVYGMNPRIYNNIKDHVVFYSSREMNEGSLLENTPESSIYVASSLDHPVKLELNAADSADLVGIRGIGPFYARMIVKYRDLLGGYYDLSQLWEVYRMDTSRFELLSSTVYLDTSLLVRMQINRMSFPELLRHPYLDKKQVADLIHYRDFVDSICGGEELKKFGILDSSSYARIAPYFEWEMKPF